jgi:hypothetical protein
MTIAESPTPGQRVVQDINERVTETVQFGEDVYYCDYIGQPTYSQSERRRGNCNVAAAVAAQKTIEYYGDEFDVFLGHCGSHFFELAVSDQTAHLINNMSQLCVPDIERAGPNGGPLFLDEATIQQLREGHDYVYNKHSTPHQIKNRAVLPIYQAWADVSPTSVGFIKWPSPGHEYLMLHSRMRKLLKNVLVSDNFEMGDIDAAITTSRLLRPLDISIDDAPKSYKAPTYLTKKGIRQLVPFRNATVRMAVQKYASLAATEEQLTQCGDLIETLYQETGPGFIVSIHSSAHRREVGRVYRGLAARARHLGMTALSEQYQEKSDIAKRAAEEPQPTPSLVVVSRNSIKGSNRVSGARVLT